MATLDLPPRPFDPITLPDTDSGYVWKEFSVTIADSKKAPKYPDKGNVIGTSLIPDKAGTVKYLCADGQDCSITVIKGQLYPVGIWAVLPPDTGTTGLSIGIPWSNYYPPNMTQVVLPDSWTAPEVAQGASVTVTKAAAPQFTNPVYELTYSAQARPGSGVGMTGEALTAAITGGGPPYAWEITAAGDTDLGPWIVEFRADHFLGRRSASYVVNVVSA